MKDQGEVFPPLMIDMVPTGRGSVAFRAPEGRAFADVQDEVRRLLDADGGPPVEVATDEFGFTWIVVATEPVDVPTAVTDVHAVNTALVEAGFESGKLRKVEAPA